MMLIDSIGIGIILPILPQLFFSPSLGLIMGDPSQRAYFYSITLAVYPIFQFFGMSFFGKMSDKYGRKNLLLAGLIVLIFSYFLGMTSILLHNFWLFLFARALGGFLGGMYSVGNALVSDLNKGSKDQKERFFNFRLPSLADKLGMTIGPALSVFVVTNDYFPNELAIPFFFATILATINFLLLLYNFKKFLRNPEPSVVDNLTPIQWNKVFNAMIDVIKNRKNRFLILSFLLFQFSISLFTQGLSLYLTIHFNYPPSKIGLFSTVMSLCLVSSIYGLTQWLKKTNCATQVKRCLFIITVLFLCMYLATDVNFRLFPKSVFPVWIISGIVYLIQPIIRLSFTTIFSESASQDMQGLIMGAAGQVSAIGYAFSALFVAHAVLSHLVMLICTGGFLISFLMIFRHFSTIEVK